MDVFEAIKNRRSIRHYKINPVDDKTVQTVLEAANWAPSWDNNQCWRFIVVRDPAVKSSIADTLMKVTIDDALVDNAAAAAICQAPVLIVVCAEMGQSGRSQEGTPARDKGEFWYMFDVALSMQNLTLAAHASGLGTVIVGGFDAPAVARLLNVPDDVCVVTMTPLGVPDDAGYISPRKPLSKVLYWGKYGKNS